MRIDDPLSCEIGDGAGQSIACADGIGLAASS